MKLFIVSLAALFLAVGISAEELKCPNSARGQHPKCICSNGGVYDVNYNWCVFQKENHKKLILNRLLLINIYHNESFRCRSDLNELSGECPADGPGIYPNCNCGVGKDFDRIEKKCTGIDRSVCPKGATGNVK